MHLSAAGLSIEPALVPVAYDVLCDVTESFRQSAEHIALVERMSDAHHLRVCGDDMGLGYLLEVVHRR